MSRVDYFLKIDGIDGESEDHKHQKEMEVYSWSFGETNSGSFALGKGGGTGKVQVSDMHFTKVVDNASALLAQACATGQHIPKATLTCRKAGVKEGQVEYLKITLTDVLVSSFQLAGSGSGDQLPHESLSLNFSKYEMEYQAQNAKGSLEAVKRGVWDIKRSVA